MLPATSMKAKATKCGRWLSKASRSSWADGLSTSTLAPIASQSPRTAAMAAASVSATGVSSHGVALEQLGVRGRRAGAFRAGDGMAWHEMRRHGRERIDNRPLDAADVSNTNGAWAAASRTQAAMPPTGTATQTAAQFAGMDCAVASTMPRLRACSSACALRSMPITRSKSPLALAAKRERTADQARAH